MGLYQFKNAIKEVLKNYDVYDVLPPENTAYPFLVLDYIIVPQHMLGHRTDLVNVNIDVWNNDTNTSEMDYLVDGIVDTLNRISNDTFYGTINSVANVPQDDEALIKYKISATYKMLQGY